MLFIMWNEKNIHPPSQLLNMCGGRKVSKLEFISIFYPEGIVQRLGKGKRKQSCLEMDVWGR
jgi:hypothetical protein